MRPFMFTSMAAIFAFTQLAIAEDDPRNATAKPPVPTTAEFSGSSTDTAVVDTVPPSPISDADLFAGQLLAPKAFRAAADIVLPSMVNIESFGGLTATSRKGTIGGIRKPGDGPTTGVIVSPDGYIITSTFNFIRKQPVITVITNDGTRHVAKLLGRDNSRKLCLLKIDNVTDLPVPKFAKRDDIQVGQWAISIGVGFGDQDPAISAGIISAKNRVSGKAEQTDANISPANYGGPLIDIEGRVLGICVPLNPTTQEEGSGVEWYDSGIGFAIPVDGLDSILTAMKAGETVRPARLGIQPKAAADGGVLVESVADGTAADKAGLKKGDVIKTFNGIELADDSHLRQVIGARVAGDKVMIGVTRDGMQVELEATLDAVAEPEAKPDKPTLPFKLPFPQPK